MCAVGQDLKKFLLNQEKDSPDSPSNSIPDEQEMQFSDDDDDSTVIVKHCIHCGRQIEPTSEENVNDNHNDVAADDDDDDSRFSSECSSLVHRIKRDFNEEHAMRLRQRCRGCLRVTCIC